MSKLSIITPFYRRKEIVESFLEQYSVVANKITNNFEIIIVDDSPDDELFEYLKKIKSNHPYLRVLKLSKNWGQHPAVLAGLHKATGDLIAVTDCGMREDPNNLISFYEKMKSDKLDLVIGVKDEYKAPFIKKFLSKVFWKIFNFFSGLNYDKNQVFQRLFNKKVHQSLLQFEDVNLFWGGLFLEVGYKKAYHPIEHSYDKNVKTTYSFFKSLELAVTFITSFSVTPLRVSSALSFILFLLSLILIIIIIYRKLAYGFLTGFASTMCVILFCASIQLLAIGIIGEYLAKNNAQTNKRPRYFIDEEL